MGSCLSSDGGRNSPSSPSSPARRPLRKGSRKKMSRTSSLDARREEQLQRTPGRMFFNGASAAASLFSQQGKKGPNQDAMIVWENFGSRSDTVFCGVFDGHGPYGHMVAKRVRDVLPLKLSTNWGIDIGNEELKESTINHSGSVNSEETSSLTLEDDSRVSIDSSESDKQSELFRTLKSSFLKAFKLMDKELKLHPNIDCFYSGTTAVALVKQGEEIVIGNVGDSRAVLGTRDEYESLVAVQLTVDLKPNLPEEAERIRRCRGRVFALRDEPEVARVWLPNNDTPGLAMARALGDFCLKDFGLISIPEFTYRRITERDEFIVLATDGVWDVLSNKEVVEIVASAPDRSIAARFLVELAVRSWRMKYPTSKVDDCAVVCLFLDSDKASIANTKEGIESHDVTGANYDSSDLSDPTLDRLGTVRHETQVLKDEGKESPRCSISYSHQQPSDVNVEQMHEEDWSALEGVSRVNTLLTLPRYVKGGKQQATNKLQKRA